MSQNDITETEAFKTPEQIAAHEVPVETPAAITEGSEPKQPSHRFKLPVSWPPNRQEVLSVVVVLLLASFGAYGWWQLHRSPKSNVVTPIHTVKKIAPKPTTVASTLTGLPVDPSINQRPVTGVMIENSLDARPQAGLSQAGVVFEAIAEGGITRFLALYQDQQPDNVGPIRSARPYYLQWDQGFDAPLAHVGGSPEALQDIKSWQMKDLDQFANSGSYHRVSSRAAPHNVYTGVTTLNQLETTKGYTGSSFSGFVRKADAPSKQPNAGSIDLAISSSLYNVHYDYDRTSNSYKRSEGGKPHLDANTGAQLSPKVVIALVIPYNLEADDKHSQYGIIGNGQAYIFQDGSVTVGNWSKASATAQINFTDSAGKPVKLNAGQTWLSAVSTSTKVNYK